MMVLPWNNGGKEEKSQGNGYTVIYMFKCKAK